MSFIKTLEIINFRNINKLKFEFKELITYFFGPNGTGKTNLLEAIQVLTLGKSLRTHNQSSIIPINNRGSVKTIIKSNIEKEEDILISQSVEIEQLIKTTKTLYINNKKTKLYNYIGSTPSIWFGIENIKALTSSPSNKRKFIDQILIQLNPIYCDAYNNYNKSLKHRNKLLKNEPHMYKKLIDVWTDNLVTYGAVILQTRLKFFDLINEKLMSVNNFRYKFKIIYKPNPNIQLSKNIEKIKEDYKKILEKNYEKDITVQNTTIGPHKDTWQIYIKTRSHLDWIFLDHYGSRGQQRMALITLIKIFIDIFNEIKNKKPILLLDDIFSELDDENISILTQIITNTNCQTFITGVKNLNISINSTYIDLLDLINN